MAVQQRRSRMRHSRLGDAFEGGDEFVASYETSDIMSGDSWNPGSPGIASDTSTDNSGGNNATVSVQQLQQQMKQGLFSNPQVPAQYNAQFTLDPRYNPDYYVGKTGAQNYAQEVKALKAFGMWSGGGSPVEAAVAAGLISADGTPTQSTTQPASSASATAAPIASTDWLTQLLTWLQSPISPGIQIQWYWVLLAAGAAVYLMRDEK